MLDEFGWNPAPIENPGHNGVRDLHFEMAIVVPEEQVARGTLMELVDELGQLSAANLTSCPAPEHLCKRDEGATQLFLVCHRRLLAEESLDALGKVSHDVAS